jgi:hypothetical protein
MKVKTSKRTHVWAIQKKVGGEWTNVVDSAGPLVIRTRKMARNISREYKNISKTPRSFRVKKLS